MTRRQKDNLSYVASFMQTFKLVIRGGRSVVWALILLKVTYGFLPLLYISVYSSFINAAIEAYGLKQADALLTLIPSFILIGILNYFSQNVLSYLQTRMNVKLSALLRLDNIAKISKLEYSHIENESSYDLIKRIRHGTHNMFVSGFFAYLSFAELLLKIISIALYVLTLSPWLSLILIILCAPVTMISLRTGKQNYKAFAEYQKVERRINDYEKVLINKQFVDERSLFGYTKWFSDQWSNNYTSAANIYLGIKRKMYASVKLTSVIVTLSFLSMILFLMFGVFNENISIGEFSAISNELLTMSTTIAWMLPVTLQSIAQNSVFIKDVNDFKALSELNPPKKPVKLTDIEQIEFRNVTFRYPGTDKDVLKNLSFTLEAGKSYALVGENGAGKTTITKLLLGLYTDYSGEILINSINIKELADVNALFSVAFQDFAKYEISIRNNIVFGQDERMSEHEIRVDMSTLMFDLDDSRFPDGLNTEIGYLTSKNTNLSLGQWQKLILIRSLAHGGMYYILDEPTASLDPIAEASIYSDFMRFISDKSSLIITHRLGAARMADEIIVLNNGSVEESGTHAELHELGGFYHNMYEAQKGWYA